MPTSTSSKPSTSAAARRTQARAARRSPAAGSTAARAQPAPASAFRPIKSARAFEEIAAQIRKEVGAGRLTVGSRLASERALAEQFGVSRNTLREALRSLEHVGLIRLRTGAAGGAFIAERSGEAIVTGLLDMYHLGAIQPADLTEARIWLESLVVREACLRATPADLEALHRNIEEAAAAYASGDFPTRARSHLEFHRILARMTGNPIMVIVMGGVLDVLQHFVDGIGDYNNTFVLPSRRRFMKHMEEGDVHGAVEEMEASLKRLQRSYLSQGGPAVVPVARAGEPSAVAHRPAVKRVAAKVPKAAAKTATRPAGKTAAKPASKKAAKKAPARRAPGA